MADSKTRRRGHGGEDAIYLDTAKNRYVGAVSLGFGPDGKRVRRKVYGRTKQDVRDKLKALHAELDRGLRTSPTYTVQQAVDDWLRGGLPGRSERTRSVCREATAPLLEHIGSKPLRELTAGDVRAGLEALSDRLSTRYLQIARASLARALRYAEAHDLVGRNVATLVNPPKGRVGRPSRSFTLDQARALVGASQVSRLNAYFVLSSPSASARRRPGICAGITSTSKEIPARTRLSRRRWPCGVRCGTAGTPRHPSHAGCLRCPRPLSRR